MNLAKGRAFDPFLAVGSCRAVKQQGTPSSHMQAVRTPLLADLSFHRFCWERLPLG